MQDLTGKINDGGATANGVLPAEQFVEIATELKNLLTSTGQTSSNGDLAQIVKAVAGYAHYGDFYTVGGTANAITLTSVGSLYAPTSYVNGMRVRFEAASNNSGAVTINVNGIGVVDLVNGNGSALITGNIVSGVHYEAVYDSSSGDFFCSQIITSSYASSLTPYTAAGVDYSFTHGLGSEPDSVVVKLECTTADIGYSVGNRVLIAPYENGDYGISFQVTSTQVILIVENSGFKLINKSTHNHAAVTPGSWSFQVYAKK